MIIFLDIDGVLLPFGSYNWDISKVLRKPYNYLDRMIARTKLTALDNYFPSDKNQVVLISTWRHLFPNAFLLKYLEGIGLGDVLHTDWIAKHSERHQSAKSVDIQMWLLKHPDVTDWIIIDDEDQGVPEGHWVRTNATTGELWRHDLP